MPPLVISKIHYHPEDYWAIDGDRLEFIEITNHGDATVDLTGIYFRELGISYVFPAGSSVEGHEALVLCSDSVAFKDYYNMEPFGQYTRNLSNKSERLVLVDAWGNVIDEVHYYDSDPWPWEADGDGPYLELIDLDLDNGRPWSWTLGYDLTEISERPSGAGFRVYPNPARGMITVDVDVQSSYRITNVLGQIMQSGHIQSDPQQIDVSAFPAGVYFITVGEATDKISQRFVVAP